MAAAEVEWRLIVRGGFHSAWSEASQEVKDKVFKAWTAAHSEWAEMGCTLITTLDDEFGMVGQPRARLWNFYSVWKIPEPTIVKALLDLLRYKLYDGVRLDTYFSLETVIGSPISGLERAVYGA